MKSVIAFFMLAATAGMAHANEIISNDRIFYINASGNVCSAKISDMNDERCGGSSVTKLGGVLDDRIAYISRNKHARGNGLVCSARIPDMSDERCGSSDAEDISGAASGRVVYITDFNSICSARISDMGDERCGSLAKKERPKFGGGLDLRETPRPSPIAPSRH